jgi:hypothetical protein
LSDETWARGTAGLENIGLAEVSRVIDRSDPFVRRQPRLKYRLENDALSDLPPVYKAAGNNTNETA